MTTRLGNRGSALLEVMVAVTVVATVGVSAAGAVRDGLMLQRRAGQSERTFLDGSRLLAAHTLLTKPELDARMGSRQVGPWIVEVNRGEAGLFHIAIREAGSSRRALVETWVFRPEAEL